MINKIQRKKEILVVAGISLIGFAAHLLTNGNYGFHRDELYLLDCGRHPSFGYADMPPFAPMAARLTTAVFGETLQGLRIFPSLLNAVIIFITGFLTREMGGKIFAQVLAAVCILTAPVFLISGTQFQTTIFDEFFWVLICFLVLRVLNRENPKLWILIGIILGIGLLNKYTLVVFSGSLLTGLFFSPGRSWLKSGWVWLAAFIALLFLVPNLLWEYFNHWPVIEHMHALKKDESIPAIQYLLEQGIIMNPLSIPVWLGVLFYFLISGKGRKYGIFAWGYLLPFLFFLIMKGKSYYLSNAYPALIAGGSVFLESGLINKNIRWPGWVYVSFIAVIGIIFMPLWIPVLSIPDMIKYRIADVRYDFREMVGWEGLVDIVAFEYHKIPEVERSNLTILAANYGEAGAINHYGPSLNLPVACSGIGSYYYWGYGNPHAVKFLSVGYPEKYMKKFFSETRLLAVNRNSHGIQNEENGIQIVLCSKPLKPISAIWPEFRHF